MSWAASSHFSIFLEQITTSDIASPRGGQHPAQAITATCNNRHFTAQIKEIEHSHFLPPIQLIQKYGAFDIFSLTCIVIPTPTRLSAQVVGVDLLLQNSKFLLSSFKDGLPFFYECGHPFLLVLCSKEHAKQTLFNL